MDRLQGRRDRSRTSSTRPARSSRRASPAPPRATSASCRKRSSARASSRCCRTPTCTEREDMEVILMEKIANLGELGDVVKVKDGYARNFLIPHGKAKRATEENLQGVRGAARRAGEGAGRNARQGAGARREARRPDDPDHAEGGARRAPVRLGHQLRHRGSAEEAGPRGRARADPHAAGAAQAGRRVTRSQIALHTDVDGDDHGLGARRAVSFRRLR